MMRGGQRGGISFRSPEAMLQYTQVGRTSMVMKEEETEEAPRDKLGVQMELMKENCVVAAVLNTLIMLKDSEKRLLQRYLEALLAEEGEIFVNYIATLKKGVSSMGKVNIRNLALEEEGKMIMQELFNMAKNQNDRDIGAFFKDKVNDFMKVFGRKLEESAAASGGTRDVGGGGHNEGELADLEKPYDETTLFLNLVHALKSLIFSTLMPENKDPSLEA